MATPTDIAKSPPPPLNPQPVQAPSYTPELAKATTYTATPYKVEPQGLVQERLRGVIAEDSPLMQQAARIASQKSNDRGLLNSSMAIGEGHQAVIGAATPIATTDANAINTAMMKTADQQNAASQFNAQTGTNVSLANSEAANKARAQSLEGTIQLTNTKMTQDAQWALARLDANTKAALTQMDNQTRLFLQSNQSASNAYVQTVTSIGNILNNPQLGSEAKNSAIASQLNMFREQLNMLKAQQNAANQQTQQPEQVVSLNIENFFQSLGGSSPSPTPTAANSVLRPEANPPRIQPLDPSGRRL